VCYAGIFQQLSIPVLSLSSPARFLELDRVYFLVRGSPVGKLEFRIVVPEADL